LTEGTDEKHEHLSGELIARPNLNPI